MTSSQPACMPQMMGALQLRVAICDTTSVLDQSAFDAAQRMNCSADAQSSPANMNSCTLPALYTPHVSRCIFALVDMPVSAMEVG